ncbi:MAG: hypothetical protein QNJ61_17425, partial [Desulfobacterales bacterium]|nr:hypothetical protein [Desulfobacterales bacterium]
GPKSYLQIGILVSYQGGCELQAGGIHRYFEDLQRASNTHKGQKTFSRWFHAANQLLRLTIGR